MDVEVRASSAGRLVVCAGSVGLESQAPAQPDSDDALEGTTVHAIAEMVFKGEVGSASEMIDRTVLQTGVVVTGEMAEAAQAFVDHCLSLPSSWYKSEAYIPFRLVSPTSGKGVQVGAHGDFVAFDEPTSTLYIRDLKYGYKLVEAPGNWQLICYAIGAAIQLLSPPNGGSLPEENWPIWIDMGIHQPRPYHEDGHIRTWRISGYDLWKVWHAHLGNVVVDQLHDPNAQCVTGPHCTNCKALSICNAAHRASMNAVDVAISGVAMDMDDTSLAKELDTLDRAERMLKQRHEALKEMATSRIKQGGHFLPGWGLEPSVGQTTWKSDTPFDTLTMLTGIEFTESKPITPAEAQRRGLSDKMYGRYTHRPPRGATLKRVDINKKSLKLFGEQ